MNCKNCGRSLESTGELEPAVPYFVDDDGKFLCLECKNENRS